MIFNSIWSGDLNKIFCYILTSERHVILIEMALKELLVVCFVNFLMSNLATGKSLMERSPLDHTICKAVNGNFKKIIPASGAGDCQIAYTVWNFSSLALRTVITILHYRFNAPLNPHWSSLSPAPSLSFSLYLYLSLTDLSVMYV